MFISIRCASVTEYAKDGHFQGEGSWIYVKCSKYTIETDMCKLYVALLAFRAPESLRNWIFCFLSRSCYGKTTDNYISSKVFRSWGNAFDLIYQYVYFCYSNYHFELFLWYMTRCMYNILQLIIVQYNFHINHAAA